jgi:thioredoxin reductase (NADPH)
MSVRDLIIVGAGPSGLSAAIAAKQRNLDYHVIEQGVLVNSIYRFPPQMVFFTTPELLEIGGLPFMSPFEKPTRAEALNYYRKVVDKYDVRIAYEETVTAITREIAPGEGPMFAVETRSSRPSTGSGSAELGDGRGVRRVRYARHVVMAIGYYDHPVLLGIPGEDLPHVHHYYSEPHVYYRQRVMVVGGANSAAEASLEMYRAGAHVTLVHRGAELKSTIKYWVRPDIENRIKEGSIAARFSTHVCEIRPTSVMVTGPAGVEELPADSVLLLTGYRADNDLMARAGVTFGPRNAPAFNPDTFETNVPGLFVAGGAMAGDDTGTVFIENGRFHGEKIVEVIAGRT